MGIESRRSEETFRVKDAAVGDSTATIQMPIWNESIESIKDGETYTLTNGYTGLFKGSLRLHVGEFGSIASAEEPIVTVNTQLDMSAKDYSGGPRSS